MSEVNVAQHKVKLGGKEYIMVAGRILLALKDSVGSPFLVNTEIVHNDENSVIIKATVSTPRGMADGHAESDKVKGRGMEKESPIEIAETSAIGRALGFLGYAIEDGIASYEEVRGATPNGHVVAQEPEQPRATKQQIGSIVDLAQAAGMKIEEIAQKLGVASFTELTEGQAKKVINRLQELAKEAEQAQAVEAEPELFAPDGEAAYRNMEKISAAVEKQRVKK